MSTTRRAKTSIIAVLLALWLIMATPAVADRFAVSIEFAPGQSPVTLQVLTPTDIEPGRRYPVIMVLPPGDGSDEQASRMVDHVWAREAIRRDYIVVSPAVLGPRFQSLGRVVIPVIFQWMNANLPYDRDQVVLAGSSNGGLGVFHVATESAGLFQAFIASPGGYQGPRRKLGGLRDKPVWIMAGELDRRWAKLAESTGKTLESLNASVRVDILEGQSHGLNLNRTDVFDWIDDQLGRERPKDSPDAPSHANTDADHGGRPEPGADANDTDTNANHEDPDNAEGDGGDADGDDGGDGDGDDDGGS